MFLQTDSDGTGSTGSVAIEMLTREWWGESWNDVSVPEAVLTLSEGINIYPSTGSNEIVEKDIKETIQRVIDAGERAVEELIKVAEEEIITGKPDDELAADRLKNAAATKKLAIFDAFEILQRIENERDKLNGDDKAKDGKEADKGFQSFAEARGRKS